MALCSGAHLAEPLLFRFLLAAFFFCCELNSLLLCPNVEWRAGSRGAAADRVLAIAESVVVLASSSTEVAVEKRACLKLISPPLSSSTVSFTREQRQAMIARTGNKHT